MRKYAFIALIGALMFAGIPYARADVTVSSLTSLVTSSTEVADGDEVALFSFTADGTDSETLSSVTVTVNSTTAVAGDIDKLFVYKDDGDGSFDSGDQEAGNQSTVNIGTPTVITTGSNNTLTGSKFFVTMKTDSQWGESSPADSVTVTIDDDGINTSADDQTVTETTTSAIHAAADETGPTLVSAVAQGTGSAAGLDAGDKIVLTYSESTDAFAVTSANIMDQFSLSSSHTFRDGANAIGSANWSDSNKVLTITLSAGTSLPTVAIGDTVTDIGDDIEDAAGNDATGNKVITGSFTATTGDDDNDDGDDEDQDHGKHCGVTTIINGRLYKIGSEPTVYLAAGCRLKPFRGQAAFHARGHKFQDVIVLDSLPSGITISDKPALPASGTLVKCPENKTVFFISNKGKRGFTNEDVFKKLGLSFNSVEEISCSDEDTIEADSNIDTANTLPEGMVFKCTDATVVFKMESGKKHGFTALDTFLSHGRKLGVIAILSPDKCSSVQTGENIDQ